DNKVARAEIIVPTGQNQISIEKNLVRLVEENIDLDKEQLSHEIEKFVRAYDPCISCATHFLKINFH
ncbi:MAG TPA: Ni/Fe hydrogenase subunit alpha, partial [Candidatus Paceibacterota bacterium]